MNAPLPATHEQIRTLLQLPLDARAEEVFECVSGCLTDALRCQLESPTRVPGKAPRYEAAWLGPDGTRYEGQGYSQRDAALAAALRLIEECEDAALLRKYGEPELVEMVSREQRPRRKAAARRTPAPGLRTIRRAGAAE